MISYKIDSDNQIKVKFERLNEAWPNRVFLAELRRNLHLSADAARRHLRNESGIEFFFPHREADQCPNCSLFCDAIQMDLWLLKNAKFFRFTADSTDRCRAREEDPDYSTSIIGAMREGRLHCYANSRDYYCRSRELFDREMHKQGYEIVQLWGKVYYIDRGH